MCALPKVVGSNHATELGNSRLYETGRKGFLVVLRFIGCLTPEGFRAKNIEPEPIGKH